MWLKILVCPFILGDEKKCIYAVTDVTQEHNDREKIAARSVEILLQCIGEETSGVHELVPFRIISGESTRRI